MNHHDQLSHQECLEFIRSAISENDPQTARDVASVVKEVCHHGYANREAIWAELTPHERSQFQSLVVGQPAKNER